MINKKELWLLPILGVLAVSYYMLHKQNKKTDAGIVSRVLPPNDTEKLILNPVSHSLITITKKGTKVTYLPNRPVSVEVTKQGEVKFTSRPWGTELSPFAGFGYSGEAKMVLGAGVFYYHRLDLNVFASITKNAKFGFGAAVSYNVYSNTNLFVGVDVNHDPIGGVYFRF